jgi:hypothetical protein
MHGINLISLTLQEGHQHVIINYRIKTIKYIRVKCSNTPINYFFYLGKFGVHYIWYQSKDYNTWTLNKAKNVFLPHALCLMKKLTKKISLQTKKLYFYCDNGNIE